MNAFYQNDYLLMFNLINNYFYHCRIFADGTKTNSGTGTAIFSENFNIMFRNHNTEFQAECMNIRVKADYGPKVLSEYDHSNTL